MTEHSRLPVDRMRQAIEVGDTVRVVKLSGGWFDELPADERVRVESMIGREFVVERIDEYGQPWVSCSWGSPTEGMCAGHSVALEPSEMLLVRKHTLGASQ
jgi:hypothetical protein